MVSVPGISDLGRKYPLKSVLNDKKVFMRCQCLLQTGHEQGICPCGGRTEVGDERIEERAEILRGAQQSTAAGCGTVYRLEGLLG